MKNLSTVVHEMFLFADNLSEALEKLKLASTDSATDSVESCLDCLLKALANNSKWSLIYTWCVVKTIFFWSVKITVAICLLWI